MAGLWEKLSRRSCLFSAHFLIHIYNKSKTIEMFYVDNNENMTYNNQLYSASSFRYTPKVSTYGFDGGGKLEIAVKDTQIINLVELSNDIYLDVVACINEDGTISKVAGYNHHYGSLTGNRKTVTFDFEKDDRLSMTFPTLIWSTQNNRGNS